MIRVQGEPHWLTLLNHDNRALLIVAEQAVFERGVCTHPQQAGLGRPNA